MAKEIQYQALISDVRQYYKEQEVLHRSEPVYLTWFDDCKEINLWTYWQGRRNLDARIMLVGQDWGCPAACSSDYMQQFTEINEGKRFRYWLDGSSITDNNLITLFSSIGYDVSNGATWNRDLFFSNYVLGYRNSGFPAVSSKDGCARTRRSSSGLQASLSPRSSFASAETPSTAL